MHHRYTVVPPLPSGSGSPLDVSIAAQDFLWYLMVMSGLLDLTTTAHMWILRSVTRFLSRTTSTGVQEAAPQQTACPGRLGVQRDPSGTQQTLFFRFFAARQLLEQHASGSSHLEPWISQ